MSTIHEKVQAQQWAFYSKPTQPFHRHLVGPVELEVLLKMVEQLQPKPHAPTCQCVECNLALLSRARARDYTAAANASHKANAEQAKEGK